MGKKKNNRKGKKNKKNTKSNVKEKLSVTIATPTMITRVEYLRVLIECILHQDYNNILEWIIVDGTQNDKHELREHIEIFRKEYTNLPEIVFLEPPSDKKTIGDLRNLYNQHCRGDIIVCMDDDDYYPQTRVSHCVKKLSNSHLEIGACATLCIYCLEFKKVYEWKRFHVNQGGNASMAYTKNYAKTHTYDSVSCGEERTFIKNYMGHKAEPGKEKEQTMIQFDNKHSLLSIAHNSTYKKTKLFYNNEFRPKEKKFIYNSSFSLGSYVTNKKVLKLYKQLFKKTDYTNEDITIIMKRPLYPLLMSKPLTDSDNNYIRSVVQYFKNKNKSKNVIVYTNIQDEENKVVDKIKIQNDSVTVIDDVEYRQLYNFDSREKRNHVIAIGKESLEILPILNINYNHLHFIHNKFKNKLDTDIFDDLTIDTFISRSKQLYDTLIDNNKYLKNMFKNVIISPLSIDTRRIDNIIQTLSTESIKRNTFRLCYTNSYEKGLLPIIQYLYPELKKLQPKIELHLYGKINKFINPKVKNMINKYIDQSGIIDHGVCSYETIIKEKQISSFQLYFSNEEKVDSLSVKESFYCGCIPVLSNKGVFKNLKGLHFDFNTEQVQSYKNIASILAKLLNDEQKLNKLRVKLFLEKDSIPTIQDECKIWDSIIV